MADQHADRKVRDRAIWLVRLITLGGVTGALGLSWGFGVLAEAYFSGKPPAPPPPPNIPNQPAPVQKAPPVIVTIVHHPYKPGQPTSGSGSTPRPPSSGPAPPPPPPVVCHSTPSKPC
jgi:hypothetical protein